MPAPAKTPSYDELLAEEVANYYADPLGFVLSQFSWTEPGMLEHHPGPDTWQAEFLAWLGDEVLSRGFDGTQAVDAIRAAVSSGHGIGKALSKRTELHTPRGLQRWGDLHVGDQVFAEDGTPTTITGLYDQGERELFRVVFDDGTEVEADADHLWKVSGRKQRRGIARNGTWVNLTTAQIAAAGVQRPNGRASAKQWKIPIQGPAKFPARAVAIHPYTLGVWLGDGGRKTSIITSNDPEVIARLRSVGETVTKHVRMAWHVPGLCQKLREMGIGDRYSYQKSVPIDYLENSEFVRAEVLRGLLDTDGECNKKGSIIFNSCSAALARDVVWLARSLGGKARIQPTVKKGAYRAPSGELLVCRPCWRATLTMPAGFQAFYVARKEMRVRQVQSRYLHRWISRIEPIGRHEAMCITVDHPSSCFLANDFVVTHNSVCVAWLVLWIMSTRPHCQGTITANTITQLDTKTWAAIETWTKRCKTGHWFTVNSERMFRNGFKESWFVAPQSSKENNSEAFAGQHAASSTSFYIVDEASSVPDTIYEVAEGGLTDGEPMIFIFGNPTRSQGAFHRACFGSMRHRWHPVIVDARTSRFTNKALIEEWATDYGEDSDFFRVRVRGLPPSASDVQFISTALVTAAQTRQVVCLPDDPLICGLDLARGGADDCVFRFRRGLDARTIPPIRVMGAQARDSMKLVTIAADVLNKDYDGRKVAAMFVDATGGSIGGPIADRLRQLGFKQVIDVQFGGESPDPKLANMRAYMWSKGRDWLVKGAIDASAQLETDLTGPSYSHDRNDRLLLESKEAMKKRGLDSPDDGDALFLTLAQEVRVPKLQPFRSAPAVAGRNAWMQ